jgi:hypothetical protein
MYASLALIAALVSLGGYEAWALWTNHITLSRLFWGTELGSYGLFLPLMLGLLVGHFVLVNVDTILAFLFGFVGAGLFWHKIG